MSGSGAAVAIILVAVLGIGAYLLVTGAIPTPSFQYTPPVTGLSALTGQPGTSSSGGTRTSAVYVKPPTSSTPVPLNVPVHHARTP